MKIMGNFFNPPIDKKTIQKNKNVELPTFKSNLQSMDSITISDSSKGKIAEEQFVSTLRGQISSELNKNTPAEDLDNLAGQISRGEYEIGANEIAKKLLLCGRDS